MARPPEERVPTSRAATAPAPRVSAAALEAHLPSAAGPELDPLAIREAAGASAQMTRKVAEAGARGRVTWVWLRDK